MHSHFDSGENRQDKQNSMDRWDDDDDISGWITLERDIQDNSGQTDFVNKHLYPDRHENRHGLAGVAGGMAWHWVRHGGHGVAGRAARLCVAWATGRDSTLHGTGQTGRRLGTGLGLGTGRHAWAA